MPKQEYCCLCHRRCKLNSRRHVPPGKKFRQYVERTTRKDYLGTDVLCNVCTARVNRSQPTQDKVQLSRPEPSGDAEYLPQQSSTTVFNSPKSISLQIPSTPRTVLSADGMELDDFDSYKFLSQHQCMLLSKLEFLSTQIIDVAVIIWSLASSTDMHLD